ncbi:MAG: hypothetical protein NC409_13900 [Clostridium sp.]|nr:hypothetical protein [Clostridium sp.]
MTEKRIRYVLLAAMFVGMCGAAYIILAYSKDYFHSDFAGFLFLAKEQFAQKKMFPDGFHYTTDIFFLMPSVTMAPFFAVLDNELLIHELGMLLYIIILCALIFKLFWNGYKKAAAIAVTFFLLPLSWVITDIFFLQGAYLVICLFKVLLLIAIQHLFATENDKRTKRCIAGICYLAAGFLTNYAMLRGIATDMLPILFAFLAMILLREGISVGSWIKQKTLLLYSISTVVIIVVSGIHYVLLCNRLGFDSLSLKVGLVDSGSLVQNILKLPAVVLEAMGWVAGDSLFQLTTVKSCGIFVYAIVSQIMIPLYLLSKVHIIKNKFLQFMVLYINISNFTTSFVMVATGAMESRYYLPAYFNNLLLLGLVGKWLLENKYEELKAVPAIALLMLTVFVDASYIHSGPSGWKENVNLFDPQADQTFYDFLLEHDLAYGYATFWNAYPITFLSNEKVVVVAHDAGKPTVPYYFNTNDEDHYDYYAISEHYYDPTLHPGRCFVLVAGGETIPEVYYQLAEETLTYENFTILVYGNNINEYPELTAAR